LIAVDSTVLADWLFNGGPLRESALRLQAEDGEWVSAALARYELGNVAWKLTRAGLIAADDVVIGWAALSAAAIEFVHDIEWAEVSALALAKQISYYDAAHAWVAISRGIPLYSRDGPLRNKCPELVRAMPAA
jgi:predicted nucleic acid-binding protein